MKARITYRKKCIKKHKRTSFIAAVVVVLSIGLAVGSYRGHIQKENEKKMQEIAQELQEEKEQEQTIDVDLSLLQEKLEQMTEAVDGTWSILFKRSKNGYFIFYQ